MEKIVYYNSKTTTCEIIFQYSDKSSFYKIIQDFPKNLNVREILGDSDNLIYKLLKCINYDKLLLSEVGYFYIHNQQDLVIAFYNTVHDKQANQANLQTDNMYNQNNTDYTRYDKNIMNAHLNVNAILLQAKPKYSFKHFTVGLFVGAALTSFFLFFPSDN